VVIAPHSAPLDMLYYTGNMFPKLKGKLILSWHGYRKTGQRIVAYNIDKLGRPIITHKATYSIYSDNGAVPIKRQFPPSLPSSWATEIINGWNPLKGYRPKGRPVGMTVAEDGSIWILDDTNKAVLRLAKGKTYRKKFETNLTLKGISVKEIQTASLFKKHCSVCHADILREGNISLPINWLEDVSKNKYRIESRLFDTRLPQMPPGKTLPKKHRAVFKRWLKWYRNSAK